MRMDSRLVFGFDWALFLAVMCLSGAGLAVIWSTTDGTALNTYFIRQLVYLGLATCLFLILLYFDYHVYCDFIVFIYASGMALLILVLILGQTIHSNKSWIRMGDLAFQPSEVMKIIVIIALAKYYAESERDHLELNELIIGGLIAFIPMGLVILQGDLGTAVTFVPIYVTLTFLGGLRKKHVIILLLAGAVTVPIGWMMLKGYQKGRIETVINPSRDPHGMGYQTIQSEIAIGSGRFLGKGFTQGSQGQLGFLPARHTDFIFAVLSEEKGFVGSISVLALFLFALFRLLKVGREAKDKIGTLLVVGVASLFLFHTVVNIGMVVGLLPIAGIPLPFVSAGGSSLVSCFAAISLCMNVRLRRYVN